MNIVQQLVLASIEIVSLLLYMVYIFGERIFRLIVASRPLKSLDGEVVLITGTGNGIGHQLALQLSKVAPKAKFICWDVELESNESTVTEMKDNGAGEVYAYTVDLSNRDSIVKAAQKIREDVGHASVIINNAGICSTGPFLLQKPESIVKTFEVNLFAHFWIIAEFLPEMIRRNHGHIVTIASIGSFVPMRDIGCYVASKHAVHGFIESLKKELQDHPAQPKNIHFTTVYPVIVQTRLSAPVKLKPRFPAIFPPPITPNYVAKKTIEGFRRNYEYLCLPPYSQIIAILSTVLPMDIAHRVEERLMKCDVKHENLDPEDVRKYKNEGTLSTDFNNSKTL